MCLPMVWIVGLRRLACTFRPPAELRLHVLPSKQFT